MKLYSSIRQRAVYMMPVFLLCSILMFASVMYAQDATSKRPASAKSSTKKVFYGQASFYSNKFNGRRTASGEIFHQSKMTCASNILKLGTWIKLTNVRNGNSAVVKVNDRLHPSMKRIVDLTSTAAKKLGFTDAGLARVKVEVLGKKKPAE